MSLHVWGEMVDTAADDPVAAVLAFTPHPQAVAGYVGPVSADNRFVTFPQLVHHFHSEARCLSIGVHMEYPAEVGDFEAGDMGFDQAGEWHRRRLHEGFYKPCCYFPLSAFDQVKASLDAAGAHPSTYRMFPADVLSTFAESRANAVRLLREEFFGAVQFWQTNLFDVSLVRRDFWPDR